MTLHLSDIRPGMVLTWIYDGRTCLEQGKDYVVDLVAERGLCVRCLTRRHAGGDDGALPGFRLKQATE